jgi:hypothetical protein
MRLNGIPESCQMVSCNDALFPRFSRRAQVAIGHARRVVAERTSVWRSGMSCRRQPRAWARSDTSGSRTRKRFHCFLVPKLQLWNALVFEARLRLCATRPAQPPPGSWSFQGKCAPKLELGSEDWKPGDFVTHRCGLADAMSPGVWMAHARRSARTKQL